MEFKSWLWTGQIAQICVEQLQKHRHFLTEKLLEKLVWVWEESKLEAQSSFAKGSVSEMNIHTWSVDTVVILDCSQPEQAERWWICHMKIGVLVPITH